MDRIIQPPLLHTKINNLQFGSTCSTPNTKDQFIALVAILLRMVGPLTKYPGRRNHHPKIVYDPSTDWLTDWLMDGASELFLPQLTAKTHSSYATLAITL